MCHVDALARPNVDTQRRYRQSARRQLDQLGECRKRNPDVNTITAVRPGLEPGGARVVDVHGLVVSPGFVDVHSHVEAGDEGQDMVGNPAAENNVRQGVTTVIGSPDGGGSVQVAAYLEKVAAAKPAINVGTFTGHGSVRSAIVGLDNRPATAEEMERMRSLVRTAMREGAFGLSTGLFYVPGNYAPLEEVIELARVAGETGGIHQSHMRDEAARVLDSVRDAIAIGERGHLPTQVTHHKIIGKVNWGRSVDTLRLIDEARARGVDATIDQYPYTASSTSIQGGLVPQWAQAGGREKMLAGLRDENTRGKVLAAIATSIETDRGGGDPANVVLAACAWDPGLAGKSLAQVLRDRGRPVTIPRAAELVVQRSALPGGAAGVETGAGIPVEDEVPVTARGGAEARMEMLRHFPHPQYAHVRR